MGKLIKVFVGEHCLPCSEVKERLKDGKFAVEGEDRPIDMVDVETEEGFAEMAKYPVTGVPAAFDEEGKQCQIFIDEENDAVILRCPDAEPTGDNEGQ